MVLERMPFNEKPRIETLPVVPGVKFPKFTLEMHESRMREILARPIPSPEALKPKIMPESPFDNLAASIKKMARDRAEGKVERAPLPSQELEKTSPYGE